MTQKKAIVQLGAKFQIGDEVKFVNAGGILDVSDWDPRIISRCIKSGHIALLQEAPAPSQAASVQAFLGKKNK